MAGRVDGYRPYFADSPEDEGGRKLLYQEAKFHFTVMISCTPWCCSKMTTMVPAKLITSTTIWNHLLAAEAAFKLNMLDTVEHILEHLEFTAGKPRFRIRFSFERQAGLRAAGMAAGEHTVVRSASDLDGGATDEARYYRANSFLAPQSERRCRDCPERNFESLWGAYGYFNLGACYVNKENSPPKHWSPSGCAATLTDQTPEGLELRDHINMVA